MLPLTYLLPLCTSAEEPMAELGEYLRSLAAVVDEVVVVDGSDPEVVVAHRAAFGATVSVIPTQLRTPMGKVGNVLTGLRVARHDRVVIADDDVRYRPIQLAEVAARLDRADVVRPQNYFDPLPWHARVDTARTLLARASGGDWPGTLAVRRRAVLDGGGYAGDVLFENLELVRTVVARGGREDLALGLLVCRRPPTVEHFWGQQVRQAYDELARPARLVVALAVAPAALLTLRRRWPPLVAALLVNLAAEAGRRSAGGRSVYPASSSLLAAPWLLWRSCCAWVAMGAWLRGGVRYRGGRLRRAATPMRALRSGARAHTAPPVEGAVGLRAAG